MAFRYVLRRFLRRRVAEQTDVVQAAVLGLYPDDIRAEVPVMLLKWMAGEKKK